jgi:hypothetical protein
MKQSKEQINKLKIDLRGMSNGIINLKSCENENHNVQGSTEPTKVKGIITSTTGVRQSKPGSAVKPTSAKSTTERVFVPTTPVVAVSQDKQPDYRMLYEKQKEEVKVMMEAENSYRKQIEQLKLLVDKGQSSGDFVKKIKEVEMDKEALLLTVLEFIKKTSKYVPFFVGNNITTKEIDGYFNYLEGYLSKLVTDNKTLNKERYQAGSSGIAGESKLIKFNDALNNILESPIK